MDGYQRISVFHANEITANKELKRQKKKHSASVYNL